jgi:hypothetical protein
MTIQVILQDREMLWFPVLAGLLSTLIIAVGIVPIALLGEATDGHRVPLNALQYLGLFGTYFGVVFIATFFNVCTVYTTKVRLSGGDATFAESLRFALGKASRIAVWSLIAASVGIVLGTIESAARESKNIVTRVIAWILRSLVGAAWTVVSMFVVPAMVYHDLGPVAALRASVATVEKTWGENLIRHYGLGLVQFVLALPAVLGFVGLGLLTGSGTLPGMLALGIAISLSLYLLGLGLLFGLANSVFKTALYHFASSGATPQGFDQEVLASAFRRQE